MSNYEAPEALVRALAERHQRLYLSNAWFHASINQLADFLLPLVDGLARQAEERQAEIDENVANLNRIGSLGLISEARASVALDGETQAIEPGEPREEA